MRLEEAHAQEQEAHVQEIQQWKDQYRRVEKERHQLAAQLEEVCLSGTRFSTLLTVIKVLL
jgi:chaperonin cofactor prefoldin